MAETSKPDKRSKTTLTLNEESIKRSTNKEGCFDKYAGLFDLFSKSHSRRIDGGDTRRYGSFVGIILSICLTMLLLLYTLQKFEILIWRKDDRIILTELPYFYDDNETMTGYDKFNIAFGLEKDISDNLVHFEVELKERWIDEN